MTLMQTLYYLFNSCFVRIGLGIVRHAAPSRLHFLPRVDRGRDQRKKRQIGGYKNASTLSRIKRSLPTGSSTAGFLRAMQDLSTKRSAKSRSFWTKRSSARPSGCTTRRCADLWLIYRTPRACPLLSRPQEILHDRARNLDRLRQSKEPRNDQKVNAATERA